MIKVVMDSLGSDSHLYITKDEVDEITWDNLLFHLGYEHVDSSDDMLDLTIIGSSIYNEEKNNAELV